MRSAREVFEQLTLAGLLEAGELRRVHAAWESHATADDTAESCLTWLIGRQALTRYQALQLRAGKARALLLGNYRILDKVGQGGMGVVYKAVHRRMKRVVALKVLSPSVIKSPDMLARFEREVEAAARLSHPHIVTAYDADEARGTRFLVLEFVDGRDLASVIREQGPLPVAVAVDYVLQAARGLEYAHRQGMIHRDIKPGNLLVDAAGTVKILDLGLARFEGDGLGDRELTTTGDVMGTVDYMSPEQAMSTKSADQRSDVYSLGVTLWTLLVGRPPYAGDSMMARLIAHREAPIPSLSAACADVPEQLEQLFRAMVAKLPTDRPASMTAVIDGLQRCRPAGHPGGLTSDRTFGPQDHAATMGATAHPGTAVLGTQAAPGVTLTTEAVTHTGATSVKIVVDPPRRGAARRHVTPMRRWWAIALGVGGLLIAGGLVWRGTAPVAVTATNPVTPSVPPVAPPKTPDDAGTDEVSAASRSLDAPPTRMSTLDETWLRNLTDPQTVWSAPLSLVSGDRSDGNIMVYEVSPDERTLVYANLGSLCVTRRTSAEEPIPPNDPLMFDGSPLLVNRAALNQPGTELLLSLPNPGTGKRPMQLARRADPDQPFGPLEPADPIVNATHLAQQPVLTAQDRVMYCTVVDATRNGAVWRHVRRESTGPFERRMPLPPLVPEATWNVPVWVSEDEGLCLIRWQRDKESQLMLWRLDEGRYTVVPAWLPPEIHDGESELQVIPAKQGTRLYVSTSQIAATGKRHLWRFDRIPLAERPSPPRDTIELLTHAPARWLTAEGVLEAGRGVDVTGGAAPVFFNQPHPGSAYRLELTIERAAGSRHTELILPLGQRECAITLHASPKKEGPGRTLSGLSVIDGEPIGQPGNPGGAEGVWLKDDTRATVVCEVRPGRLRVTIDDHPIVEWRGDFNRLGLPPNMRNADENHRGEIGLVQWSGKLRCFAAKLTPLPPE